jgi:hypothetical protein
MSLHDCTLSHSTSKVMHMSLSTTITTIKLRNVCMLLPLRSLSVPRFATAANLSDFVQRSGQHSFCCVDACASGRFNSCSRLHPTVHVLLTAIAFPVVFEAMSLQVMSTSDCWNRTLSTCRLLLATATWCLQLHFCKFCCWHVS